MFNDWTERFQRGPFLKKFSAVDVAVLCFLVAVVYGIISVAAEWGGPMRRDFVIDLDPHNLPHYAMLSVFRGIISYLISLVFSLVYGYWAAKSERAEYILIPLLDILQGIPVLGFLPGLVLTLVSLFPHSNIGLELACILAIFTSQAWNMTFSFYSSVKSIPQEMRDVAHIHRLSAWKIFKILELPFGALGLVWNSMVSMAGGWFFLMVCEALHLGDFDFRLPGIGSYMSVAIEKNDYHAMSWGLLTMAIIIVVLDQVLWRPLLAWAQRFRTEETLEEQGPDSLVLRWLRRSEWVSWIVHALSTVVLFIIIAIRRILPRINRFQNRIWSIQTERLAGFIISGVAVLVSFWGGSKLFSLMGQLKISDWGMILGATFASFIRIAITVFLASLWAIPLGLAIGRRPQLTQKLQPVIQMIASYPATMIFPLIVLFFEKIYVPLGVSSIFLMLLASQWYLLFNVISGASQIPADMIETMRMFNLSGPARWKKVYLPAIFPHLVTGWITVAGGAWNATIVAEYLQYKDQTIMAYGLGGLISQFTSQADYARLAASIVVMALTIVVLNRTIWASLYDLAHRRYVMER